MSDKERTCKESPADWCLPESWWKLLIGIAVCTVIFISYFMFKKGVNSSSCRQRIEAEHVMSGLVPNVSY